ncbi:FAD:protein FMN transferase [Paracoccus xiamenensis]|uniref:FAD:protein FMN transferase n=1 Tax=Paracoccus xiamenensis TaxID=2714901 RepID=UPI00140D87C5|nr:FAD:protein FMN transferase [Paracoccus xiamenensis]NHF74111.1 FAD:protein FMN transferase [Paracoccus xiamenensis]
MNRRRFLTITAASTLALASPLGAQPQRLRQWHGVALGSAATIALDHPQADRLIGLALAEIDRLEGIFSLYRTDSALARLNVEGMLHNPPFELLDCLSLCGRVHAASDGRFDPTVQPLWQAHAESWSRGAAPDPVRLAQARALTGWDGVSIQPDAIRLTRPGMALTLNGVAQGVIADRVADLLRAEGLADVLVDTGEIAARGHAPEGRDWPVTLSGGQRLTLSDRALASSSPRGTVFDAAGMQGHILDPETGLPVRGAFGGVSISASSAGLADALSTAACLARDDAQVAALVARFPGAKIEALLPS